MNSQPLVSVCINVYNAAHTIRRTIDSVLSQTYPHLQIIVVDDVSNDNTLDILRSYDDERLEIIPLAVNDHISCANNAALAHARGDYVAHLDADDVWHPTKIETQLHFMQTHPEYDACFCLAVMVDEHNNRVDDRRFRAENGTRADMLRHMLTKGNFLCHSSMFAKRTFMNTVGEHDPSLLYFHDYDYWLRMLLCGTVYVLEDPLLDYRLSSDSNSYLSDRKHHAHANEIARVIYRTVVRCDDTLFREAFASHLRKPSLSPTPERTAFEKAFWLLEAFIYFPQNRALGLQYLAELMADKRLLDVARTDFGFTVHDYYALCASTVYHDAAVSEQLAQAQDDRQKAQHHIDNLSVALAAETAHRERLEQQLASIEASAAWKLTHPLRTARSLIKRLDNTLVPRLKNGKRAACVIAMYGYFAHNLGDDLFFDTLLRRYPDTLFVIYDADGYAAFFDRYPNANVFTRTHSAVQRANAKGETRGIRDAFEHHLLRRCDAVVHIGGSIYQQIGTWEDDLKLREKRIDTKRPFFSLSSNFGPYHTDGYRKHWHDRFSKSRDICFRDTDSAALFPDLPAVRYAPDLLFVQALPDVPTVKGQLFLSAVDLRSCDTVDRADDYTERLAQTATRWIQDGGTVCLSSFCAFQHDDAAVADILARIPATLRHAVTALYYTDGNFDETLTAIASSEVVLATRFHAMVFALAAEKPTLPVCYHSKMTHVLKDIGFDGMQLTPSSLCDMTAEDIVAALRSQPRVDIAAYRDNARAQFDKLDDFVSKRGGQASKNSSSSKEG
ncbi:MAG: glycosyltransferase [Clostridia bacterium]|nr:glycosyltransferase [Clostridia bacterium]